ncbi:UNVERIFIED_CONTAM: YARHG domain-containing protein [Acetivibrio alkalicellulosi]
MLKCNKYYFIIILFAIFCFSYKVCYSNSPPLVMKGNTVYPINNNNIRLVSEKITIRYDAITDDDTYNMHEVEVVFNFHNTGNETELEIGFPNTANYNETLIDFEALSYTDLVPFNVELYDGGNLLGRDEYYYTSFYKWNMHFEKDEKKSIIVRYKFVNHKGADYILRTGSLWKGRIDKIEVYVEFPEPVSYLEIYATPENYLYNGKGIEWHFENINPDFDLYVKHVKVPDFYDLKREAYNPFQNDFNDYVWDKSLFYIGTMIDYEGQDIMLYDYPDTDRIVEEIHKRLSVCELVRNEIYARNGYVFKDPKWMELFSIQQWYEPDENFNFIKLNDIEKINIEQIIKFENTIQYTDDITSDELINNFIEYSQKYNDKKIISYTGYNVSHRYANRNYNKIMRENERIKENRSKFQELIILPCSFIEFITDEKKQLKLSPIAPETLELQNMYVFGDNIIKVSNDENTKLLKHIEGLLYVLTELDSMKVKSISPSGKYAIISGSSIPGFIEDDIYLVSMDDGIGYLIGNGDFENYQFEWSIKDSLQYRHKINNRNLVKHFNSTTNKFTSRVIPINDFEKYYVSDDETIAIQSGNIIYYMGQKDDSFEKIVDDGNLIGFSSNCKVLFYEGSTIKEFDPINSVIRKLAEVDYPIWKTECVNNNYIIYCGIDIIYCYNQNSNTLYKFNDIKNSTDLKFSPEGDKLLVHIESIFDNNSTTYIIYGNSNEKRPLKLLSQKSVWIDNNYIVTFSVDLDNDEILKTITNISDEVTLYFSSDSKSIGKLDNSVLNRPINYIGFIVLIILCIIYWLYKKKIR